MFTQRLLKTAASLVVLSALSSAQAQTMDVVTQQSVERAESMLPAARAACEEVSRHPTLSTYEIEDLIRETIGKIDAQVHAQADVAIADELFATLARNIGNLDAIPSLDLQLTRATVDGIAGRTESRIDRRALNLALLLAISRSGDGKTAQTAYRPCLVANEYYFARAVLGDPAMGRQRLREIDGRYYDLNTIKTGTDDEQDVYFDITDGFKTQARMSKRQPEPGNPPSEE